MQQNMA